jgi:arylsulfatase A-like enzyme
MKYQIMLKSAAIATLMVTAAHAAVGIPEKSKNDLPNIIIIFIDDEGYGDPGCFGGTGYTTPNIDQLASEGMRFTNYYSGSAVSSPSRAALLTGCYPPRVGITRVLFPYDKIGLNSSETTIADMLKANGYATAAIGKWHLGWQQEFLPLQHGFDEYFGLPYSNDMWPVNYNGLPVSKDNYVKEWKLTCPPLPLIDGNKTIEEIKNFHDMDQLTTRYTERAVDFIERNKDKPFFLYMPHTMAHVPLGVSDKFRGKSEQGFYGDVMMELDWSVGQIMLTLKTLNIDDNTLVIYATDNGPWLNYGNHAGSAGGLREGKGAPFEGGFRVPCIMHWPAVIPSGTICNKMASAIDVLPTIAAIVKTDLPEAKIDGINILPLMKGVPDANPRCEYYYYSGRTLNAIRIENWKYVFPHKLSTNVGSIVGKDGWPGQMRQVDFKGGLFDMRRDPGEQYDMQNVYPEIAEKLKQMADRKREELGDLRLKIEGKENRTPGRVK